LRNTEKYNPPDSAIEALARCLYPAIRSYFESEEGKKEFAQWQARRGIEYSPGKEVKPDRTDRLAA